MKSFSAKYSVAPSRILWLPSLFTIKRDLEAMPLCSSLPIENVRSLLFIIIVGDDVVALSWIDFTLLPTVKI